MPRIKLAIFRKDHPPALAAGLRLPAVRLVASVSLATSEGWTSFDPAVIDTGAPVCLFPPSVWTRSLHRVLGRVTLGGISRRTECHIPAFFAIVDCILSDGQKSIGPLRIRAYLAERDEVPTLIGVHGFIEKGVLHVELARDKALLSMT